MTNPVDDPNRRRHVRVPLTKLLQFRVSSVEDVLEGSTVDLSESGVFVRTDQPRPVGTRIYFRLHLEDGTRVLEGQSVVARCVLPGGAERPGMALHFVELDEENRQALRNLVVEFLLRRGLDPP